jgi:type II secretory ATPase GspE/PulE/Tfp pilus assembly ATPase PilB-like protein
VALYEVLRVTEEIRNLILKNSMIDEIKAKAIELGMKTLRMSGLEKVQAGITTPSEVVDHTAEDESVVMA